MPPDRKSTATIAVCMAGTPLLRCCIKIVQVLGFPE